MRILFILRGLGGPNGTCVQSLIGKLNQRGHEITVLGLNNGFYEADLLPNGGGKLHSIKPLWSERKKQKLLSQNTKISAILLNLLNTILKFKPIQFYFIWPVSSPTLKHRFIKKALQISDAEEFDAVITVNNPIYPLIAGHAIKEKHPNVLFVPYFLDPLVAGSETRLMKPQTRLRKAFRTEKKYLDNADGIILMKSAQGYYEKHSLRAPYMEKISYLDLPLLDIKDQSPKIPRKHFPESEKVFLFAGSIPRNIRNPEHILQLFSALKDPSAHLYFIGSSEYEWLQNKHTRECPNIHMLGRMTHSDVMEHMAEADYLVNIGNSLTTMVPCKIFEYMSFGKPIVSTYKLLDDPCIGYLKQYQNAISLDEHADPAKNAALLRDFLDKAAGQDYNDQSHLFQIVKEGASLYNNTPDAFVQYLEKLFFSVRG